MAWLDDFNKVLGTAGDTIDGIQRVLQPNPPQTTVPTTPKQAQVDTKTAQAQTTDGQPATVSPALIAIGAVIVLFLLME